MQPPRHMTSGEMDTFRAMLTTPVRKVWLLVVASAIVSCNHGAESIVALYRLSLEHATFERPHDETKEVSRGIQRTIQEILVKGSVIFGIPKSLDTMFTLLSYLRSTTPEYLLTADDFARASVVNETISSLEARAEEALRRVYRHNLDDILERRMGENMEDLRFLALQINYGFTLANQQVMDWRDTELVLLAALVTQNCTAEVLWHMRGALRAGWTREDVECVTNVAMLIAHRLGVRTDKVPSLAEVKEDSND